MTEADGLIAAVERARATLISSVVNLSDAQAAFKPGDDQWSTVQVLEHLYLAELSGVAKIWAALAAFRAGRCWAEARPNRGKSIEEVVTATWKVKEVAPPIATPHIGEFLRFHIERHAYQVESIRASTGFPA